ncbi:hypothetical protein Y696_07625 [Mesotoga sp. H07pep.5.4]|nr:hypothetical protein Y696_07625 [Mesotoga sp. H07pep.5.4]
MNIRGFCLIIFLILTASCFANLEMKVDSGVSMPWSGFLEVSDSERTQLLMKNDFRAYFLPTVGYEISGEHLIELSFFHFTVKSTFEATDTDPLASYESMFKHDVLLLTYMYILPELDRFSLQLGVQGRLWFKQLTLTGSKTFDRKVSDLSFGPAADLRLQMNDKVFIGLDVSTGLGKGNGFIDMFAGLHFEGPFYYVRAGTRYWSVTNSFDNDRFFLSFVNLGVQFCAVF